jgi:hypothetical protein
VRARRILGRASTALALDNGQVSKQKTASISTERASMMRAHPVKKINLGAGTTLKKKPGVTPWGKTSEWGVGCRPVPDRASSPVVDDRHVKRLRLIRLTLR